MGTGGSIQVSSPDIQLEAYTLSRQLLPIILRYRWYSWDVLAWGTLPPQFRLSAHFIDVPPKLNRNTVDFFQSYFAFARILGKSWYGIH